MKHTPEDLYVTQIGDLATTRTLTKIAKMITPEPMRWTDQAKADADHLVRCWNAHHPLVATLASSANAIENYINGHGSLAELQLAARNARMAIASVKGPE